MFFSRHDHIPAIRSSEAAAQRHDRTAPIRGRGQDIRPLRYDRRQPDQYSIRRCNNEVWVRMHHTDIAKFREDNTVVVDMNGWHGSQSTRLFVRRLLGIDVGSHRGRIEVISGEYPNREVVWLHHPDDPLVFNLTDMTLVNRQDVEGVLIGPGRATQPRYKKYGQYVRAWKQAHKAFAMYATAETLRGLPSWHARWPYGRRLNPDVLDDIMQDQPDPRLMATVIPPTAEETHWMRLERKAQETWPPPAWRVVSESDARDLCGE